MALDGTQFSLTNTPHIGAQVRKARMRRGRATRGHRATGLRLWTSLMDLCTAPALALGQLYAQRWEHDLYFREVNRQVRRTDLLQSHTVDIAAQEIAALVLASALLAVERTRVANGEVPVLRVSFGKMLRVVEAMWVTLDIAVSALIGGAMNGCVQAVEAG